MAGIMRVPENPTTEITFTINVPIADRRLGAVILVVYSDIAYSRGCATAIYGSNGWNPQLGYTERITSVEENISGDEIALTIKFQLFEGGNEWAKAIFLPPPFDKSAVNWVSPAERQVA